jgi:hypothetical protein
MTPQTLQGWVVKGDSPHMRSQRFQTGYLADSGCMVSWFIGFTFKHNSFPCSNRSNPSCLALVLLFMLFLEKTTLSRIGSLAPLIKSASFACKANAIWENNGLELSCPAESGRLSATQRRGRWQGEHPRRSSPPGQLRELIR